MNTKFSLTSDGWLRQDNQEVEVLEWTTGEKSSGAIVAIKSCPNPRLPGTMPIGSVTWVRIGRLRADFAVAS